MSKWKIRKLGPSEPSVPGRIVPLDDGTFEVHTTLTEEGYDDLFYLQKLLSEERGRPVDIPEVIEYALDTFIRVEMESRTRDMLES